MPLLPFVTRPALPASGAWWQLLIGSESAESMLACSILILIGMALITKGGDWFTDAAVAIARATRIPTVIVGATIVSLATTFPELMVSLTSAWQGVDAFAVGNALGSCCCNIGLIVGTCAMLKWFVNRSQSGSSGIPVSRHTLLATGSFMLAACLITWLFALLGSDTTLPFSQRTYQLERWQGAVLLSGLVLYLLYTVRLALAARFEAQLAEQAEPEESGPAMTVPAMVGGFAAGATVVILGSRLMVANAEQVALMLQIDPLVVGLTVLAVGTSLPEYTISLLAVIKGHGSLGLGNIMGANILNLFLVVGTCAAIRPLPIQWPTIVRDAPVVMLLMTLLILLPLRKQLVSASSGVILFTVYVGYLFALRHFP